MEFDENSNKRSNRNAGFKFGLIGGFLLCIVFMLMLVLTRFNIDDPADIIAYLFSLPLYYIIGRSAANAQYNQQRDSYNPTTGVEGAGQGAAMITCLMGWIFIYAKWFVRDAMGVLVIPFPLRMCGYSIVSFMLAIAIGRLAGSQVAKKYTIHDDF